MLINQGIIINVVLIFAILWLANYLSEDSIVNTVKNIFNLKNLKNLNNQTKKYNLKNLNDEEAGSLETFLKSLIVKSKGGKTNYNKLFKPNEKDKNNILKFLEKKIRNDEHKISNINVNNIIFYKKDNGFEFKPFILEGNYYYNDKLKGIIKLQLEISFKFDNPDSIFISPQKITNHSGNYFIHRINFLDLKNTQNVKLKKITSDSENIKNIKNKHSFKQSLKLNKKSKTLSTESENSEDNSEETSQSSSNQNNSDNQDNQDNQDSINSDNSLIPDEIEFSTEYNTSLNTSINLSA